MENRKLMLFGWVLLGSILVLSLYGIGNGIASDRFGERGEDEHESRWRAGYAPGSQMSAEYALYREECGSCHMAYPVQFLPPQSWSRIMNGLDDHFGESAELDAETRQQLESYLSHRAQPIEGQYRKLMRNNADAAPLRITQLSHFRHEHDEIPSRYIQGNDKVGSLSQCNACHRNAEKGWFDEDNVVIPGVGRWDD